MLESKILSINVELKQQQTGSEIDNSAKRQIYRAISQLWPQATEVFLAVYINFDYWYWLVWTSHWSVITILALVC